MKPFIIKLNNTSVTVLGTSFNIKEDSLQTSVSVKTGKVSVKALESNKSIIVEPNYTAVVESNSLKHFKTKNKNYLAWKTGVFQFDETPLDQAIKDLNTFYEAKLKLSEANTTFCSLTAKFNNKPLAEIIEILKLTCDIVIEEESGIYKIINQ